MRSILNRVSEEKMKRNWKSCNRKQFDRSTYFWSLHGSRQIETIIFKRFARYNICSTNVPVNQYLVCRNAGSIKKENEIKLDNSIESLSSIELIEITIYWQDEFSSSEFQCDANGDICSPASSNSTAHWQGTCHWNEHQTSLWIGNARYVFFNVYCLLSIACSFCLLNTE